MKYRVHIHAADGGAWIASKDFARRPTHDTINAAFGQLRGPGWFEVRVNRLSGADEIAGPSWTQEDGTRGRKTAPAGT